MLFYWNRVQIKWVNSSRTERESGVFLVRMLHDWVRGPSALEAAAGNLFGGVSSEVGFQDGQSRWDVGWRWRPGRSEESPGSSKESGGARLWHNRSCK